MEAGHLRLDKHHRTLESSCSGWAVNRKLQEYINEAPACVLAKLVSQQQVDETSCMMEAIAAGDQMVEKIFNETMDDLAHGLSHIVHLLNPDIIIMGGGLSLVGQPLVTAIGDRLPNYLMSTLKNEPPVISLSALQEKSVPIGAIELAKIKIRAEPKS